MNAAFTWLAILLGFIAGWIACSLASARRIRDLVDQAHDEGFADGWTHAVDDITRPR